MNYPGLKTSNYELEFVTKSTKIRYLLRNATTHRDSENNIIGVVGVAQDVTESKKNNLAVAAIANELHHLAQDVTEAARRNRVVAAMAHKLRQFMDTANAPIFRIDVNGNITEWNEKTADITGYSKEEAFNKPLVSTFIIPSLRQSVQEVMDRALLGNETSNYELVGMDASRIFTLLAQLIGILSYFFSQYHSFAPPHQSL